MNTTELLQKLKVAFNELVQQKPEEVKMLDAKLADGTVIQVTEMAVGGIVTINGTPAPAGEHKLEDGTIIVVGDNGAIMEIKPAQAMPEEQPPMVEDMGAKFSSFEISTNEKFAAYEAKMAEVSAKFAEVEEKLTKTIKNIELLMQLTKSIAETPTGIVEPTATAQNNFKEEKKVNYDILFS